MDLLPNEDQQEIVDAAVGYLANEMPVSRLHEAENEPIWTLSRNGWREIAELGWLGLGLDEARGGIGFSLAEETLLFRELGRYLAPTSLLAGTLAARVAALAGHRELAEKIVAGDAVVGFAEARDHDAAVGAAVRGRFHLIDAQDADLLLCSAPGGLAVIDTASLGAPQPLGCIDEHVSLSGAELSDASALAFLAGDAAERSAIRSHGAVLVAAMLVGNAEASRDLATRYACERMQFGRPIGVFQAVKHKCADMAVRCEAALSQTLYASLSVREARADARLQASAAKALAADAAIKNGRATIQVHGGYGVTAEYDPHLYVKRAHVLERILGDTNQHLRQVLAEPAPL